MCSTAINLRYGGIDMAPDARKASVKRGVDVMFFVILEIATGTLLYAGRDLSAAASQLVPGTCFGRGDTFVLAFNKANRLAKRMRRV
jgi:hypothetical protein